MINATESFGEYCRRIRKELELSREAASGLMDTLSPEKIEKIEKGKQNPDPYDVLEMAKAYKKPELWSCYCTNECPIGRKYIPEIKIKDLSQIVLEVMASLNRLRKEQERFVEITEDGSISDDEIADFVHIQKDLEKMEVTVKTLQLWTEQVIAEGKINVNLYEKYKR